MKTKKILCLTDLSEETTPAIFGARTLANRVGASHLVLFHAFICPATADKGTTIHPSLTEQTDTYARNWLNALCTKLKSSDLYGTLDYTYLVRQGDILETFLQTVNERGIDLVVVPMQGMLDKSNVQRTSLINALVSQSPCPVMLMEGEINYQNAVFLSTWHSEGEEGTARQMAGLFHSTLWHRLFLKTSDSKVSVKSGLCFESYSSVDEISASSPKEFIEKIDTYCTQKKVEVIVIGTLKSSENIPLPDKSAFFSQLHCLKAIWDLSGLPVSQRANILG